ncbi:MAG: GDP-L-fucose synthase [Alphaproteobacteria bacterium]|nr:GDP-L-fucose synthase [Alphaproteobacteria bacterium]
MEGRKVWVAGHGGMVGTAIVSRLERESCTILTVPHAEVDLRNQAQVEDWLAANKPEAVFLAAGTVGGIHANDTRPAEFIYDNIMMVANVVNGVWRQCQAKLLYLGSSCIYPRLAPQPMTEEALLSGGLEPTNQWYALAKISGIKLCQAYRRQYGCDFISAMPTNLYGPHDNYDLEASHVVPALIAKTHAARESGAESVEVWGTGKPKRELLYVEDLADALVFLMKSYSQEGHINVGTGVDVTIADLAALVARVIGFEGRFDFVTDKPDGAPRKLLDVSRLSDLGWRAQTDLEEGLRRAYAWYRDNVAGTT